MHKIHIGILLGLCSMMLAGCGIRGMEEATSTEAIEVAQKVETASTSETKAVHSYLTGELSSASVIETRPLAVMFNNIKEGCPQSGIAEAKIVYEAPVEGRITRLMGMFEDYGAMEKIGSIRSSRDYFVYFALEYDAIYAHFGQATMYVGDLLNSDRVDNISGAVSGIDTPAVNAFFRSTDRKAPHNVYISAKGVAKDIKKLGYRETLSTDYQSKFLFAEDGERLTYDGEKEAVILYPGGKTNSEPNGFSYVQSRFEYNEKDGLYYRYQYGDKQIDELTGNQLTYSNVIFQYCHGEVRDENDYLAFGCHGDNQYKVQVFTAGKMIEGTWKRDTDNTPAIYYDSDGKQIELNQGKTWICIVWDEYGDDVVIE